MQQWIFIWVTRQQAYETPHLSITVQITWNHLLMEVEREQENGTF